MFSLNFLADCTLVMVELLSWLLFVCLSITDVLWLNGARWGLGRIIDIFTM